MREAQSGIPDARLHPAQGGVRPATILHVDDDPNDAELLRAAVQRSQLPLELQWADGGEAALAYLQGHGLFADRTRFGLPSLILLDFKMPLLNGLDVLQRIRQLPSPELRQVPVVVLSGSHLHSDVSRSFQAGANSYLVKPLSFEALVSLVRGVYSIWLAKTP